MAALPIAPLSDRSDMAWLAFIKAVCWPWRDFPDGAAALADVAELLVCQLAQHARALAPLHLQPKPAKHHLPCSLQAMRIG